MTKTNNMVPRLAMINSFAGFGRCSTTVSLPVISAMGVQVCPVPTSVLSNHLAYPKHSFLDFTPHMNEYLKVWKELAFTFDGLYCGFLGNVDQIKVVKDFIDSFAPKFFLLDPVMGDNGRTYSSVTVQHVAALRKLLRMATLITPNLTEACLLSDMPYHEGAFSDRELRTLCEQLASICSGDIVITGIPGEASVKNIIWQKGTYTTLETPLAGGSHHGTGDIFASILAADSLFGRDLVSSVKKAADFISTCIAGSEEAGVPEKEGVLFEKYLHYLITP